MTTFSVTDQAATEPVYEAPKAPLLSLKQRREELVATLYKDLRVPRWSNPEVWVRYRPLNATEFSEDSRKRQEQRSKDWALLVNADLLIKCCIGVYGVLDGDDTQKYSFDPTNPTGQWTRFDPTLAESLGLPKDSNAVNVVRKLYLSDGDLIAAANQVMEFSGLKNEEADANL